VFVGSGSGIKTIIKIRDGMELCQNRVSSFSQDEEDEDTPSGKIHEICWLCHIKSCPLPPTIATDSLSGWRWMNGTGLSLHRDVLSFL